MIEQNAPGKPVAETDRTILTDAEPQLGLTALLGMDSGEIGQVRLSGLVGNRKPFPPQPIMRSTEPILLPDDFTGTVTIEFDRSAFVYSFIVGKLDFAKTSNWPPKPQ